MADSGRRKLGRATVIYWMMLVYIIAALVWWFITLEKQNRQMTELQTESLIMNQHTLTPAEINTKRQQIKNENSRNTLKYVAEGVTFLILILIGASFIYRSVRRQFIMQLQQQNFMMAVTHELKTPIAVARLNLETMLRYSLEPEKQKKLIRMTLEENSRLLALTNNILISAQLEGGGYQDTKEELNLSDLLMDCLNNFRSRLPDRIFNEKIEKDVDIKGDSLLLQMLINNLLENAIKYSPRDRPVMALLEKKGSGILLQVIDEGEGIPEEEKKKIFHKFYRIGNETTRKAQGTGLGLYLCRIIARDHNADISVTNNTPRGSNFEVNFIYRS